MGYRSEVVLYVGPEVMGQFMVTMAKSQPARELCFAHHDDMVKDYANIDGSLLFKWEWLKWYDSYECVQALEDFMQWCADEEVPTGEKDAEGKPQLSQADEFYRFVRIGEDATDVEERGWAHSCEIGVSRSLDY